MLKNNNTKNNNSLDKIFYPNSIAIIGASNDTTKIGGFLFSQISKIDSITAYPINLREKKIQKIKAYGSVLDINKDIDLAIIVIPRDFVLKSLQDCADANIKNIIIISAGFKEIGEEGIRREEDIKKIVEKYNINLIGPNCLGVLNPEINLNCSFAKEAPLGGEIALISQSGAVIDAIIDWSFSKNIGFSKIVSLGNMAGVDSLKILKYLKDDPKTKSVVFYMETLDRGEEFAKVLREVSKKKPVIIIKPGNSVESKAAIGSHTGSLAQDNKLVEVLIKENGGIFVKSLNELYGVLIGLKSNLPKDNQLIIVTNAGGPGVIATDCASENNFELYKLDDTQKIKFDFLPKEASLNNPIDILGDAKSDRYCLALKEIQKISQVSNVLILLTPQVMTDNLNIAKEIEKISKKSKKTIYVSFLGGKEIDSAIKYLDEKNIASFFSPSDAITAMKYLHDYNNFIFEDKRLDMKFNVAKVDELNKIIENEKGLLDYELTKQILDTLKIKLPNKKIIKNIEDISKIELFSNKKYVIKADSKDLIHKTEVGGVRIGIACEDVKKNLEEMFESILKVSSQFYLTVEEQYGGIETFIGLKKDEGLGEFIFFGTGGIYVNVYEDINIKTCPLNEYTCRALVEQTKVFKILKGFRGTKEIDFKHLYELLIRISYLQTLYPSIKEVDLNPVICNEKGIYLVDVKLLI